jgi:hypothetical protein
MANDGKQPRDVQSAALSHVQLRTTAAPQQDIIPLTFYG